MVSLCYTRPHSSVENSEIPLVLSLDGDIDGRMEFSPILCVFNPLSWKIFRFCCWDFLLQSWMSASGFRCLFRESQGAPDSPKNGLFFFVNPSVPAVLHIPWIPASTETGLPLQLPSAANYMSEGVKVILLSRLLQN